MIDNQKTGCRNWEKKAHLFSVPYYQPFDQEKITNNQ